MYDGFRSCFDPCVPRYVSASLLCLSFFQLYVPIHDHERSQKNCHQADNHACDRLHGEHIRILLAKGGDQHGAQGQHGHCRLCQSYVAYGLYDRILDPFCLDKVDLFDISSSSEVICLRSDMSFSSVFR